MVDEFRAFVRPEVHPELTAFCRELTGIEQRDVDGAQPFPAVFADHQRWLGDHGFAVERDDQFEFVTCGDWDLKTMPPEQLGLVAPGGTGPPPAYRAWVNVKRGHNRGGSRTTWRLITKGPSWRFVTPPMKTWPS